MPVQWFQIYIKLIEKNGSLTSNKQIGFTIKSFKKGSSLQIIYSSYVNRHKFKFIKFLFWICSQLHQHFKNWLSYQNLQYLNEPRNCQRSTEWSYTRRCLYWRNNIKKTYPCIFQKAVHFICKCNSFRCWMFDLHPKLNIIYHYKNRSRNLYWILYVNSFNDYCRNISSLNIWIDWCFYSNICINGSGYNLFVLLYFVYCSIIIAKIKYLVLCVWISINNNFYTNNSFIIHFPIWNSEIFLNASSKI